MIGHAGKAVHHRTRRQAELKPRAEFRVPARPGHYFFFTVPEDIPWRSLAVSDG